jgi:DNA-binding MarR family transcriptional regulator
MECIYTYMSDQKTSHKSPQVRVAWHCTCFNVRRASRAVTEFYDGIMAPSGIKATQFTMLGAVALMGPASVTRLAEHLALDRTTLTRNLKVLAEQGFVEISAGADRRERVVSLTGEGQAAIERATPGWHEAQAALTTRFGEERWRRMIEDMNDLGALTVGTD